LKIAAIRASRRCVRGAAVVGHEGVDFRSAVSADRLLALLVGAVPALAIVLFGAVEDEHALPLEAAALLLGAWAVCVRGWRRERPLPMPRVTLPVLLLAALPAVQVIRLPHGWANWLSPGFGRVGGSPLGILSVYPYATTLALLRWLSYAAFLIAALEVLRRPGAVRTALSVIGALGVAEAVYGVGNLWLGNHYLLWVPRESYLEDAAGTLVNRNHYAAVMELCLPALLAARWLAPRRASDERGVTAMYLAGATVMGLAVVLSHSRGGILCLAAGLVVAAALAPRDAEGRRGRRAVGVLGVLVLAYSAYVGLDPVVQRFAQLPAERPRPALWRDTVSLVRDFPVTGAGAGTFEMIFPAYRHHMREQVGYAHAHQDYLELAAEGGVVAVALALMAAGGFAAALRVGFSGLRGRRRLALGALAAGITAILLHAAVDFPLHIPGLVLLLLLVAALALSTSEAADRP